MKTLRLGAVVLVFGLLAPPALAGEPRLRVILTDRAELFGNSQMIHRIESALHRLGRSGDLHIITCPVTIAEWPGGVRWVERKDGSGRREISDELRTRALGGEPRDGLVVLLFVCVPEHEPPRHETRWAVTVERAGQALEKFGDRPMTAEEETIRDVFSPIELSRTRGERQKQALECALAATALLLENYLDAIPEPPPPPNIYRDIVAYGSGLLLCLAVVCAVRRLVRSKPPAPAANNPFAHQAPES
jgi:hypothetical protein